MEDEVAYSLTRETGMTRKAQWLTTICTSLKEVDVNEVNSLYLFHYKLIISRDKEKEWEYLFTLLKR